MPSFRGVSTPPAVTRVTTLELFFDLVFVFTITQLTVLLVEDTSLTALWHVVVMLGLIFYMYDGYAWLTNAVEARGYRRQALLLGGMAGYLVLAVTIPTAFDGSGLAFGIALVAITLIHMLLFLRCAGAGVAAAGWGAFVFAWSCPHADPLYVIVWYGLAVTLGAALGRWLLPRALRW